MTIRPTTREAIITAAFQLISANPSASLADIAKHAGIGRATLHRYFSCRNDLLIELAKTANRDLDNAADRAADQAKSHTETLQLIMQALVPLAERAWFLSREAAQDNPELQAQYRRQTTEMQQLISAAQQEGGISSTLSTLWIAQAFDALLFAAWEMVRTGEATHKQAAEMAWQTFIEGSGGQ